MHLGRRARWRLHILLRLSWGRSLSSAVPPSPSAAHPALVFGWGGLRVRARQQLVVTWRVRVGGWRQCACSAVPATVAAGHEMDIGGEGDGVAVGTVVAGNKEATTRIAVEHRDPMCPPRSLPIGLNPNPLSTPSPSSTHMPFPTAKVPQRRHVSTPTTVHAGPPDTTPAHTRG
ncbi:hypothetical protein BJ912DRAFT_1071150 [Pholiota molesta]|nr:hypothetical protein BJ912DRAFT_1071150 [Pholiota molesta]